MKHSIYLDAKIKLLKIGKVKLIVLLLIFVIGLAVFQDYIFSKLQNTGFYISESLIYNTFWLFFIPFFLITKQLTKTFYPKNNYIILIYTLGIGAVFSFLHIIFFTFLFVLISNVLFNPPHRFSNMFNSVLSNQFYIVFMFYTIAPNIYRSFLNINQNKAKSITKYSETIHIKIGSKIRTIKTSSIQAISTDKPYSIIHANEQKFFQDKSLKDFERELDPTVFLRVHRSAIINSKFVKELKSRKNGDYDALIENGLSIRFSRHYRKNWLKLLQ